MKNLARRDAERVYRAIVKRYAAHPVTEQGEGWPEGPVLCRNYGSWSSTTRWAIVWEGGPYDWAIEVAGSLDPTLPKGVFLEPIESFSLGVYPS